MRVLSLAMAAAVGLAATAGLRADLIDITTADGAGKDAYTRGGTSANINAGSNVGLHVKRDVAADNTRKVWMGFDLSSLPADQVVSEASLTLTIAAVGGGTDPDPPAVWNFDVFGLTDQTLDGWGEATITWNNAPANVNNTLDVDATKTTLLGSFTITGVGTVGATVGISGQALVDFLNADTNDLATLIVRRSTQGDTNNNVVHNFDSGEAASNRPLLRVTTVVPEPGSALLLLGGLGLLGARRRR